MMKIILFYLAVASSVCCSVQAQQSSDKVASTKIYYSPSLPTAMRKQIPTTGKSRFFGVTGLKFKGEDVLLHIYDVKATDSSPNRAEYGVENYAPNERQFQAGPLRINEGPAPRIYYGVQTCSLDLFIWRHVRKRKILQCINSVRFNYVRFVNTYYKSSETVGVNLTWLNPRLKRAPVFNINFRDVGVMGAIGTNMLVVFPKGLTEQAVAEGFGYGADNSSSSNSWGWEFTGTDDRGYLAVRSRHSTLSDKKATLLRWDGKAFTAVKKDIKNG